MDMSLVSVRRVHVADSVQPTLSQHELSNLCKRTYPKLKVVCPS